MTTKPAKGADLELRAASGPTAVSFRLLGPGPLTIGRRSVSALQLNDPAVSRDHARLTSASATGSHDAGESEWLLDDMGSGHGTWLNGVRIKGHRQYRLREGDLIVIGPWTLYLIDRSSPAKPGTALATVTDTALVETLVSRVEPEGENPMSREQLQSLQKCSQRIHGALTEEAVAEAVLDAAVAGTDFTAATLLRPLSTDGQVDVIAAKGNEFGVQVSPQLNENLIRKAASATLPCMQRARRADGEPDQSGQNDVTALCVPIMVESMLVGFLYLHSPSNELRASRGNSTDDAFALAVAHLAALGLANLMRMDVERRQEQMEAELRAAAEAKRWLMPPRQGQAGPFTYVGESRQGQSVGGDFFDIIPLENERLAVVMGEVSGRGMPISILVSASHGFLHACLEECGDPLVAVSKVDRLYHSRIANSRCLKLWVGVFDARERTVTYVSAGHRCAMVIEADGRCEALPQGESPPIGKDYDTPHEAQTAVLVPGQRTLLLSDGFVEQRAGDRSAGSQDDAMSTIADSQPEPFGVERVQEYLKGLSPDEDNIAVLFRALERHAGTSSFDNDATVVVIRS